MYGGVSVKIGRNNPPKIKRNVTLTLEAGVITGSIVLNEMRRLTEPTQPKELNACHHLKLKDEPKADFQRYDHLLGAHNVH